MNDRSRWDPEMVANQQKFEELAAKYPPVQPVQPLGPHRHVNELLNLPYAQGGPEMAETRDRWVMGRGRRILCRTYRPRTDRILPTLVYLHGGGWVWMSIDTHDRICRELAAAGQVSVISVDYTLSPEAQFPQAIEEAAAVVRHVAEHGADWGLDTKRILIGGDSAGANLALGTTLMLRDQGGPAIKAILATYPVVDSALDTASYQEFGTGFGLTRERMAFYWSVYVPHDADRSHPWAAPMRADLRGLPPVLVLLAELDVLRSEGEAFAEKLREAGVDVETETYTGLVHGFLRATTMVQKARDAVAKAGTWLQRVAP
jgi:acetyl esterase